MERRSHGTGSYPLELCRFELTPHNGTQSPPLPGKSHRAGPGFDATRILPLGDNLRISLIFAELLDQ